MRAMFTKLRRSALVGLAVLPLAACHDVDGDGEITCVTYEHSSSPEWATIDNGYDFVGGGLWVADGDVVGVTFDGQEDGPGMVCR